MNKRLAEKEFFESLDVLKKLGFSVELLAVPHTAVGKSSAPFLSTVKEATIKLKPPEDWGSDHE
ncbi:MAG: hypothetical protein K2O18_16350 [Oscillospiraceae bacterium]|nr:hypothetical protein [Oscillospiraceae bacterium]